MQLSKEQYVLLKLAGFTDRQITTQQTKFYNLFEVAPPPRVVDKLTNAEIKPLDLWLDHMLEPLKDINLTDREYHNIKKAFMKVMGTLNVNK